MANKVSRKRMISPSIENDSSSDEDSYQDNSNNKMDYDDSDQEYYPAAKKQPNVGKRCTIAASSTSLSTADGRQQSETYRRNHSISSSTDGKSIQRKPTRRPNPKVFNRNALMARENRRRKKEHLETLERDIEMFRSENCTLKKSLKSQSTLVSKLKQEQLYLKSVIANKTEIMALLKTIKGNKIPMTSSVLSFMTENESIESNGNNNNRGQQQLTSENSSCNNNNINRNDETVSCYGSGTPTSSTSTLSCGEDDHIDNGTDKADPMLSQASTIIDDNFSLFTDFRQRTCESDDDDFNNTYDNWENILNDETPFKTASIDLLTAAHDDAVLATDKLLSTVNNEHNYFNNNTIESSHKGDDTTSTTTSSSSAPGICLHLSGGRVSLEFCATCHLSSQNAWFEEI